MPIPILAPEAEDQATQDSAGLTHATEAKILQFPTSKAKAVGRLESPRRILRDRFFAHLVDAVLVHGFSLYAAKVLAFLMALRLVPDVQKIGAERSTELFQALVAFGTLRAWALCFLIFSCLYVTLCTHYFGRTFGKALFRLKVVRPDGGLPDMRQSFLRYVGYGFTYASLGFTFLMGFLSAEKQTVHDRVSKTDVVRV